MTSLPMYISPCSSQSTPIPERSPITISDPNVAPRSMFTSSPTEAHILRAKKPRILRENFEYVLCGSSFADAAYAILHMIRLRHPCDHLPNEDLAACASSKTLAMSCSADEVLRLGRSRTIRTVRLFTVPPHLLLAPGIVCSLMLFPSPEATMMRGLRDPHHAHAPIPNRPFRISYESPPDSLSHATP